MTHLLILLGLMVPRCDWVVTTYSGDKYVIGSGDNCADAWKDHGPIPEDWREIKPRTSYAWFVE